MGIRLARTTGTQLMVAALLLIVAPQPSDAAPDSPLPEIVGHDECQPSSTELDDITYVAEQEGIPLEDAIARYGWQTCFAEVAGHLRENFPDEYAGAAITNDGRGAWIAFKGVVPEEATILVASLPVPVDLIGGRGFSESELGETLQAAYYPILSHDDVVTANGGYDIETGVITIQVQPREGLDDKSSRDQLRALLQPQPPANQAIRIEVVIVERVGGIADSSDTGAIAGLPIVPIVLGALAMATLLHILGRPRGDSPLHSRTMTPFVADDFIAPTVSSGPGFRLEPLGPQHNESDHEAWMSSIEHIRATPGWGYEKWPHPMTLEQNMDDLVRHARDFAERRGFTYTVLEGEEVIGCVYIYPGGDASGAEVQSWVRSDRAELDPVLWRHVEDWLEAEWPFERVSYAARRDPED